MTEAKDRIPTVSIGMPVYNGERYIRQALDSLLTQDFEDFELIISDNASKDMTNEISLEYAARDKRIRYYRNDVNMGARLNFTRVFELSRGEYFMWAAHDDYWDPSYIRKCLEAFNKSEAIVLAGAQCELIAPVTEEALYTDIGLTTIGQSTVKRFKTMASITQPVSIFYGIYKHSVLHEVLPFEKVHASDKLFLAKLSLKGEFVTVPEKLIFLRFGGISSNPKLYASSANISRALFRKYPFLGYAVLANKTIFQSDRLTLPQKFRLALWSTNDYAQFRCMCLAYRTLQAICPNVATRARDIWIARRRKQES